MGSNAAGALCLSVSMIANSTGNFIMGILIDHIGSHKTIVIYAALTAAGFALILISHSPACMYICSALAGLSYASGTVGTSVIAGEYSDKDNYAQNYAAVNMGETIGNAVYSSAAGFLYDIAGSYDLFFLLSMFFALIALASIQYCFRKEGAQ